MIECRCLHGYLLQTQLFKRRSDGYSHFFAFLFPFCLIESKIFLFISSQLYDKFVKVSSLSQKFIQFSCLISLPNFLRLFTTFYILKNMESVLNYSHFSNLTVFSLIVLTQFLFYHPHTRISCLPLLSVFICPSFSRAFRSSLSELFLIIWIQFNINTDTET